MLNTQPTERQERRDSLDIVKIWKTIQGEGPFVGMPAFFIRLAGCNLQCPLCDTDYTSGRSRYMVGDVLDELAEFSLDQADFRPPQLVVITGGEPFRQNLGPLVKTLALQNIHVQIETNGTLYDEQFPFTSTCATIVCSPKTPEVNAKLRHLVSAWKYVIQSGHVDKQDGLPTVALGGMRPARPPMGTAKRDIYIQPCDEDDIQKNAANVEAAVDSCLKFGYRLCLQIHKIVGLE